VTLLGVLQSFFKLPVVGNQIIPGNSSAHNGGLAEIPVSNEFSGIPLSLLLFHGETKEAEAEAEAGAEAEAAAEAGAGGA